MRKENFKILIVLVLSLSINQYGYAKNKKLNEIVFKIKKINEVHYEHVGIAGVEGENYLNFLELKKIATIQDLVRLTNSRNRAVVCYSFWALADTSYSELKSIFVRLVERNDLVISFNGCIKGKNYVSSVAYHRYWRKIKNENKALDSILIQLDSVILYSKNPYQLLLNRALENRIYKEPCKTQIASLAFHKRNRLAILYFCNWHKEEYLGEIKKVLLKYLNETDLDGLGTYAYFDIAEEVFSFNDPDLRSAIIKGMKRYRLWEVEPRFKSLLESNGIYDIDKE